MVVRPVRRGDGRWLTRAGLSSELAGVQYSWFELPLQLVIAPLRPTAARGGPRCIIEVDGRRAGYIGRNPLSGNLEYFVQAWARGGTGSEAITQFLRDHRAGDRPRTFFVSRKNARSRAALDRAFTALGWREGDDYTVRTNRSGQRITVRAGLARVPTKGDRSGPAAGQNGV